MPATLPSLTTRLRQLAATVMAIVRLPRAELCFYAELNREHITATYRNFTRPHPRYRIIRNKTMGAALLRLDQYDTAAQYAASIGKRNFGGYFAQRASARGYRFKEIDRNDFIDDIHAINCSMPVRQGRPMAASYLHHVRHFHNECNYRYFGVLDPRGKLMAYCELGIFGNFALLSRLLGYRNNDGVMHFMIVEIIGLLIADGNLDFAMYDTFFGASDGLRKFKTILGFKPYRVRYRLVEGVPPASCMLSAKRGARRAK